MTSFYPIVLKEQSENGKSYYSVYIPDFNNWTEGDDKTDAISMGIDAINLLCLTFEENKMVLPAPMSADYQPAHDELMVFVQVDTAAYEKSLRNKSVRKNVTLPEWLNDLAEENNLNFSKVLQKALKSELGVQ